jgi:UDP-N-acetylmuramyl pentapeptide synthase
VAFGPTGEAHLRICYARSAEDVDCAFDRLEDFFAGRPVRSLVQLPAAVFPATPVKRHPLRRAGIDVLRRLARGVLRRNRPRIVAVTGSVGKTVIKRTLQDMLAPHFRVRANPLSYNTEVGVALAILGCDLDTRSPRAIAEGFRRAAWAAYLERAPVDVLVLELGIRRAGDMQAHLELLRPDIAIVTPLQPGSITDLDEVAVLRAEIGALCQLREVGTFLMCEDDPALAELAAQTPKAQLFGKSQIERSDEGLILQSAEERFECKRDTVGVSSRYALLLAVLVGQLLGLTNDQIREFLAG